MSDEPVEKPADEGDEQFPLSPEERRRLGRLMKQVQGAMTPDFKARLEAVSGSTELAKRMADIAKLAQPTIPKSVLDNLKGVDRFAEQHKALQAALNPLGDLKKFIMPSSFQVTSDVLRLSGAGHPQLARWAAELSKTADFGFNRDIAKFGALWADQQADWNRLLGLNLERLQSSFYPSNLRPIEGLFVEDVESVVMLDGIALYEVPRAEIAERLVKAKSSAERREILGRRWKAISADCRSSMEECETAETAKLVKVALDGLDALDKGNHHSAQALAGSLLDTMLRKYLPKTKPVLVPGRKTKNADAYLKFGMRKYIALAPIWQAYQQYHQEQGDPIPRTFNRHATAHSVSTRQFSRRNAVQGLMLVCGVLRFVDEEAAAQQAA